MMVGSPSMVLNIASTSQQSTCTHGGLHEGERRGHVELSLETIGGLSIEFPVSPHLHPRGEQRWISAEIRSIHSGGVEELTRFIVKVSFTYSPIPVR